jgi:hypothetical protein
MIIKDHGSHIDIEGDEFLLERTGIEVEQTPLREQEKGVSYENLLWFFNRVWRTKERDHAIIYAISRVNYIHQENTVRGYYK